MKRDVSIAQAIRLALKDPVHAQFRRYAKKDTRQLEARFQDAIAFKNPFAAARRGYLRMVALERARADYEKATRALEVAIAKYHATLNGR